MKYLSLQENEYGVDLHQGQLPDNIYEDMMAVAGENIEPTYDNCNEEGSMVSNLPLLFAEGYPTSLERITLPQLERFITFMVQCSLGHDTTEALSEPQWWPKEIKFSNPLIRPKKVPDNWMANLKKLVFRCYTYHKSEYLLRFCSYLARYPREELEYVNNWDSSTSLYHKSTGKILVTFRNENMNYDKKNDSPRKSLLHNGITTSLANKSKQQTQSFMVQQPFDDIYLCDNCDAEFVGLEKMKEHEQICCEQQDHASNGSRSTTPDILTITPESNQNQFLEYFELCSKEKESKPTETNVSEVVNVCSLNKNSRRVRGSINLTRYRTIPFSSPAGIVIAKKSKTMTEETQQERLDRIERYVLAPPITSSCRPKWLDKEVEREKWVVTHKFPRDKSINDSVHQYKFPDSLKGKPVLNIKSQILCAGCRPVYIILTRLNQKQTEELKRNSSKHKNSIVKTLYTKIGPASKTKAKDEINASLHSIRTEDEQEIEPMVIEDESKSTVKSTNSFESINCISESKPNDINETKEKTCSVTQNKIMLIDLCSSDEEDVSSTRMTPDENQDTMNSLLNDRLLENLPSHKICSKACIYPTHSKSQWLMQNIFNKDNENHVNKCHIGSVLDPCIHLSPILRPAP